MGQTEKGLNKEKKNLDNTIIGLTLKLKICYRDS